MRRVYIRRRSVKSKKNGKNLMGKSLGISKAVGRARVGQKKKRRARFAGIREEELIGSPARGYRKVSFLLERCKKDDRS